MDGYDLSGELLGAENLSGERFGGLKICLVNCSSTWVCLVICWMLRNCLASCQVLNICLVRCWVLKIVKLLGAEHLFGELLIKGLSGELLCVKNLFAHQFHPFSNFPIQ